MSIIKKLQAIQSELDVPKSQFNAFGKYYYRNAEDILAAAKPICIKHDCLLTVTDEIVMLGDRFYVKATARLTHGETGTETTAYAREEETKKGMDASQITGSASSYARKYALNGLFCIDDVKDADHGKPNGDTPTKETAEEVFDPKLKDTLPDDGYKEPKSNTISDKQAGRLFAKAGYMKGEEEAIERSKAIVQKLLDEYGIKSTGEIKKSDYDEICEKAEVMLADYLAPS